MNATFLFIRTQSMRKLLFSRVKWLSSLSKGTNSSGAGKFAIDPVHQVVNSLHSSLTGETPFLSQEAQPKQVFTSTSSPIDAWVLAKLKAKIWEETYIDFGSILTNPAREGWYQLSIDNSGEGSSPSLAIEPVNPPKKIVSIDTWVQAFHVFVGVYTSRYNSETQALWNKGPPFKILLLGVTTGVTMTNILWSVTEGSL